MKANGFTIAAALLLVVLPAAAAHVQTSTVEDRAAGHGFVGWADLPMDSSRACSSSVEGYRPGAACLPVGPDDGYVNLTLDEGWVHEPDVEAVAVVVEDAQGNELLEEFGVCVTPTGIRDGGALGEGSGDHHLLRLPDDAARIVVQPESVHLICHDHSEPRPYTFRGVLYPMALECPDATFPQPQQCSHPDGHDL